MKRYPQLPFYASPRWRAVWLGVALWAVLSLLLSQGPLLGRLSPPPDKNTSLSGQTLPTLADGASKLTALSLLTYLASLRPVLRSRKALFNHRLYQAQPLRRGRLYLTYGRLQQDGG